MEISEKEFTLGVEQLLDDVDREYETTLDGSLIKPNVKQFCYGMKAKVKNHYSQVAVVSSMKKNGMGKSSLLYHMGKVIDKDKFSFERNFFFQGGKDELQKQTNRLPTGSIICMDELVRLWYSRQAMTRKIIDLNMWMAADQRKTEVILTGAIPDFWVLDAYAREGKVDVYVEALSRGIGVVFKADHFIKTDPWHSEQFDRIVKKRQRTQADSIIDKVELLEKHPCYDGLVFWNKMPHDEEKIYKDLVFKSAEMVEKTKDDMRLDKIQERHMQTKFGAYQALEKFVGMFEVRGVAKAKVLRDVGLDQKEFGKMMAELKDFKKKTEPPKQAPVIQPQKTITI